MTNVSRPEHRARSRRRGWTLEQLWMFRVAALIGGALGAVVYGLVATPRATAAAPAVAGRWFAQSPTKPRAGTLVSLPKRVAPGVTAW